MPLIPSVLESQLISLYQDMQTQTDPAVSAQRWAQQMSVIIDSYIKTATVTVTVATAGTAAAQAGTGTGALT